MRILLHQDISGRVFYDDLVYKFIRIFEKSSLSDQFENDNQMS